MAGAAGRIGDRCPFAFEQWMGALAQLTVQDVGYAATGAAVADDIFVLLIHGTMDKDHLPQALPPARFHNLSGFLLVDDPVIVGKARDQASTPVRMTMSVSMG